MPFCPECKYEYRPETSKCPDCDVLLVASLDDQSRQDQPTPEYSDELKKLIKSLPSGSSFPSACPSKRCQSEDNSPLDPNNELAKKLDEHPSWIEIAHFPTESTSQMIAGALESAEIPHLIIPGSRISWAGDGFPSTTPDILLVPEEFVERADAQAENILGENYKHYKTPNG